MARQIKTALFAVLLLLVLLLAPAPRSASAAEAELAAAYDYTVERYDVDMELTKERKVYVKEEMTVSFSGYNSHGIIRYLPLEQGLYYSGFSFACSRTDFSPYFSYDDNDLLTIYLRGEDVVRGQTVSYTISYTMTLPVLEEEGYVPLNVIMFGAQTDLNDVTARVRFPDGLADYRILTTGQVSSERKGNTIELSAERLATGVTFDLSFPAGVLEKPFDFTVLYVLGAGALALLVALAVKFLVCRPPLMTTTVNLEAPERMDPLLMGKLIDNEVDSEDLGALIFYLADKGFLKIDLKDADDPTLRKTDVDPSVLPEHIRIFYQGLFTTDEVRLSALRNSFYRTVSAVKGRVSVEAGTLYTAKSRALIGVVAVLAALLLGGLGFFYPFFNLGYGYVYWAPVAVCAIAVAGTAAVGYRMKQLEFKRKKSQRLLWQLGSVVLSLILTFLFWLFPSPSYGIWTGLVLCLFSGLTGAVCGTFLTRTKEHTEKLGHILGFKQFILYTERDKIEFMLKEEPELYYHILPYAQVLGVTDAWTDKFKGLDMSPPAYCYGSAHEVATIILWNNMFRRVSRAAGECMVSRPSSSAHAGTHSGGFGGGSIGGGFGGGGMGGC